MFMPFTNDEVESIRSIVLLGQQNDNMLLSNCSTRPITQTRSFIQRFKRLLQDTQTPIEDITKSANEQYVAIIAGLPIKKVSKHNQIPSATSVNNLASPLLKIPRAFPHKFISKFAKTDEDIETPNPKPVQQPIPTRSRSISDGLSYFDQPIQTNTHSNSKFSISNLSDALTTTKYIKKQANFPSNPITMPNIDFRNSNGTQNFSSYFKGNLQNISKALPQPQFVSPTVQGQHGQPKTFISFRNILIAPAPLKKFRGACNSASQLNPGDLTAFFSNNSDPAFICRVLGKRTINEAEYILISFFQENLPPLFVLPQQLALLPNFSGKNELVIKDTLTVDYLLEQITQVGQSIVMNNEILSDFQYTNLVDLQRHRDFQFRSLVCASYLIFIDFFSKFKMSKNKTDLILNAIDLLCPPIYHSTSVINNRCKALISNIISLIENNSK